MFHIELGVGYTGVILKFDRLGVFYGRKYPIWGEINNFFDLRSNKKKCSFKIQNGRHFRVKKWFLPIYRKTINFREKYVLYFFLEN